MASAGKIKAGEAFVELVVKDSSFAKALDRAQARLSKFGSAIAGIGAGFAAAGAAITAPLAAMAKSFADSGAAMFEMSRRTGISVESLSKLGYAATKTGVEIGSLETGV